MTAPLTLAANAVLIMTKTLMNRPWVQERRNRRPGKRDRCPEPKPVTDHEYDRKKRDTAEEMLRLTDFPAQLSGLQ